MEGLIMWDKPKKLVPSSDHNERYSSDTGIPGTYVSNMSNEDKKRWKGKIVNKKFSFCHIEIRRHFKNCNLLMLVCLKGYNRGSDKNREFEGVKISVNGSMHLSPQDLIEFNEVIREAKNILNELWIERKPADVS